MTDPSVLLICHDQIQARQLASELASNRIKVVGITHNLMEAYSTAEEIAPEFMLIEERFVEMPEFEMLLALFKAMDIRWLAVSSGKENEGAPAVVQTAKSGLFPVSSNSNTKEIAQKIREITRAPQQAVAPQKHVAGGPVQYAKSTVLIGSSTGGIDALSTLLKQFPSNCPPTVIVQHTGKTFGAGLVRLLDRLCPARVVPVEDGMALRPGQVCVAAGITEHVHITQGNGASLRLHRGEAVSGHLPSIDVLFNSDVAPQKTVGVLLTGMGRDGAEGLLKLRQAGARTIGQDEATSVVYGMPRVASELGAVQHQLPLDKIAPRILECCTEIEGKQVREGA